MDPRDASASKSWIGVLSGVGDAPETVMTSQVFLVLKIQRHGIGAPLLIIHPKKNTKFLQYPDFAARLGDSLQL